MFSTIFRHELQYWFRQPSVYFYGALLFVLSAAITGEMAGESPAHTSGLFLNSAGKLHQMTSLLNMLVFLLLPAVIGVSVYRDYRSNMHAVLYAYPFTKSSYLSAKFLSAFMVTTLIVAGIGAGLITGMLSPWANPAITGPFNWTAYLQLYGVFLLPNVLLVGGIVFSVVAFTRNIYAGFITVILLILMRAIFGAWLSGMDNRFMAALLDPLGEKAVTYYTDYWTIAEHNAQLLPLRGVVVYNRLLWLTLSGMLFGIMYRHFTFTQQAVLPWFKRRPEKKSADKAGSTIRRVRLSPVRLDFSFLNQLRTIWHLSRFDFKYIVKSPLFISVVLGGLLFILFSLANANPRWDTKTLPVTWQMLELPAILFSGVINLLTFLYAGMLVQRARRAQTDQLVDITPVSNWSLLISKLVALIKMQALLLLLLMIGGISVQAYQGYYHFEIGHYLFELYAINLIHFIIWAFLALFIQTLFTNPYLGFFILIFAPVGFSMLEEVAPKIHLDFLEQALFRYNQEADDFPMGIPYSDMDGYGPVLPSYFIYKGYWTLAGLLLLIGALLFWVRGLPQSFAARLLIAKTRFRGKTAAAAVILLLSFLGLGFTLYYESNILHKWYPKSERRSLLSAAIKKYERYHRLEQPKITSVRTNVHLFPEQRAFEADGRYWLVNRSDTAIDTLILNYVSDLSLRYRFSIPATHISRDTILDYGHFDLVSLARPLLPGDSLRMDFELRSAPQTWLRTNTYVKDHGTFIKDELFPRIGNWLDAFREEAGLSAGNQPSTDPEAVQSGSFLAKDAGRIDFEAIVSTSSDQIAIAPGNRQREWTENGRRYFHYKTDRSMGPAFFFASGRYEVRRDQWNDVQLEIYYHKDHPYNLERMMQGMKASLDYCTKYFGPYQFNQLRIVEFSQTGGVSAHAYPGTIPAGEGSGFIADVDDSPDGGIDYPFGTAVHEVAHQWWGYQVMPADVNGARMLVESLPEYVNVKVKEHHRGVSEMRKYLKHSLNQYLKGRKREREAERPLMDAHRLQNYLHYPKGALVFYALSDYLGEESFNRALRSFVRRVAFQEPPYTTPAELVDTLRNHTPDSLQYLIVDMLETATLYDNRIESVQTTPLPDGRYQVDLEVIVSKYRSGEQGRRVFEDNPLEYDTPGLETPVQSLLLADYIEIGLFSETGEELYLKKHKLTQIHNQIRLIVEEPPAEAGIDPHLKLIDANPWDNRRGGDL